jgi:hypothetical protein
MSILLSTIKDALGLTVGITTDSSSSQGITTDQAVNDAAQGAAAFFNLVSVVPGPNPVNAAAAVADLTAFVTNTIVLADDINTTTPNPNQPLSIITDIGTEIGDVTAFFGSIGLLLGQPLAKTFEVTGDLLVLQALAFNDAVLAGNITTEVLNSYLSTAQQAVSQTESSVNQYGFVLSPYIGSSGNAFLSDLNTSLATTSQALSDYNNPSSFMADATTLNTNIASLKSDALNLFSYSGASGDGALAMAAQGSSTAVTNSTASISGSGTISPGGFGQTFALSDTTNGLGITASGVQTISFGNTETVSLQEASSTTSASQTLQINGGTLASQVMQLGGVAVVAPTILPSVVGFDTNGVMSVDIPSPTIADTISVTKMIDNSYAVDYGDPQEIVDFAPNSLAGGTIGISQVLNGTVDVTTDIGAGDVLGIATDNSVTDVVQDINFTGASEGLDFANGASTSSTISNFQIGDTIDLNGIGTATGATLNANDVLTIDESGGGSVGLNLDPAGSYVGDSFLLAPDGSGGTVITPQSTDVSFTAPNQTLLILNPSAADTNYNFQPGDTIDLAGIPPGKITQASGSPGVNVSTNSSSGFYIKISPSGNGTGSIQSDGNGGSDIIESATQLITYSYTGYAFAGLPTNLPASSFQAGSIDAQFTFEVPLGYTTTGASAGYWQYSTYSQNGGLLEPVLTNWTITVAGRTLNPTNTEASNYGSSFGFNLLFDDGALSGGLTAIIKNSSGAVTTEIVTTASGDEAYFGPTPTSGGANTTPGIWTIESIACFCKGVSIALVSGDTPIESLAVGDLVRTRTSEAVPVQWIGHREVNCRRHPKPEQVWPVRVAAGAFGENLPHRDLWLSPDHAVYIDDVLIPIKHLINGTTIAQVPTDQVTYYHIELPQHDVLLAEGMPAESYLDTGDRSRFVNGGTHVALHPDFSARVWETMGCASLIVTGARLTAARQRVNACMAADRAAA